MMADSKVAVVTGSNKGIGLAIVRGLCKQFKGDVYLTARNIERGKAAVAELEKEGLNPKFHQLNISDTKSITELRNYIEEKYGGLDVLVNNAGLFYPEHAEPLTVEQTKQLFKTNFLDTSNVCKIIFPILRPHARVVFMSSVVSIQALHGCSPEIRKRVLEAKALKDVEELLEEFIQALKIKNPKKAGWPENLNYGLSKLGVTEMAMILQNEVDQDTGRKDIVVNSCCPGITSTDMTREFEQFKGQFKTTDKGADTPIYLALLPDNTSSPKGKLVSDRKIQEWK